MESRSWVSNHKIAGVPKHATVKLKDGKGEEEELSKLDGAGNVDPPKSKH